MIILKIYLSLIIGSSLFFWLAPIILSAAFKVRNRHKVNVQDAAEMASTFKLFQAPLHFKIIAVVVFPFNMLFTGLFLYMFYQEVLFLYDLAGRRYIKKAARSMKRFRYKSWVIQKLWPYYEVMYYDLLYKGPLKDITNAFHGELKEEAKGKDKKKEDKHE